MSTHCLAKRHLAAGSEQDRNFFAEHGYLPRPRFIQWLATLRCELRCPHCLASEPGPARSEMNLAQVAALLDQVVALGIGEFVITGGEPLLRPDLPEVIGLLRQHQIAWTLNTAVNPSAEMRAAVAQYPPQFVAVSVDGPADCHDRFRGRSGALDAALAAIQFYRETGVPHVVAGTTVTTRNYPLLPETFELVLASGATSWGLHLLVPEGRASVHQRLFLNRRQLRGLLEFCATRRQYFPVELADEIGYLGAEEPLVRSSPFFCGAGRTQCVVLPDGEVVPCTTLDRSCSAGNVCREPLQAIWEQGFGSLRSWEPSGKCAACAYAPACMGGCWLQRRHGSQCYRQAWSAPRLTKATAAALCFGLSLTPEQMTQDGVTNPPPRPTSRAVPLPPLRPVRTIPVPPPARMCESATAEPRSGSAVRLPIYELSAYAGPSPEQQARLQLGQIEEMILAGIRTHVLALAAKEPLDRWSRPLQALGEDPVVPYFKSLGLLGGKAWSPELARRCDAVVAGLGTRQVSLNLAALLWRDLAEACLDGPPPAQRPEPEQQKLVAAMTKLGQQAAQWRRLVFHQQLGPFVQRELPRSCFTSKAGPPPWAYEAARLTQQRWGPLEQLTEDFVEAHRFGQNLDLRVHCAKPEQVTLLREGKSRPADQWFELRIFDLLRAAEAGLELTVNDGRREFTVALPSGCWLSYPDLLRLVHEQHAAVLRQQIAANPANGSVLALPALRQALATHKDLQGWRQPAWLSLRALWLF